MSGRSGDSEELSDIRRGSACQSGEMHVRFCYQSLIASNLFVQSEHATQASLSHCPDHGTPLARPLDNPIDVLHKDCGLDISFQAAGSQVERLDARTLNRGKLVLASTNAFVLCQDNPSAIPRLLKPDFILNVSGNCLPIDRPQSVDDKPQCRQGIREDNRPKAAID